MDTFSTLFVVACGICLFVCSGLLIALFLQVRQHPDTIERPFMIICSVICIIFYMTNISVMIPMQIMRLETSTDDVGDWLLAHPIAFITEYMCWHIAQSITYLLFILRTYYIFYNTRYQSKSYIYCLMYFAIVLFMLCAIGRVIIFELYRWDVISWDTGTDLHAIEITIKTVIDLTLSIFMIRLFCSKLLEVALDLNPTNWHGLLGVAAKISVLSIFAVAISQVNFLCDVINLMLWLFNGDPYLEKFIYYKIVLTWCTCLDSTINAICVYMAMPYPSSEQCYYRMCRGCHALCLMMTRKRIKRKLMVQSDYRPLAEL